MARFNSFQEFYPYYLSEHRHPVCRSLHYVGSSLVIGVLLFTLFTQQWRWLWLLPVIGYGFAWLGHFLFEHNKPATFKYPFYSLAADWVMLKDFLTGQLKHKMPPG
ncbi:DUF962 domain-containing protein [Arsukibacterium sp.]|uniref:DUF962 domain-containing protein n=1 Tax=Arsukibacterium sp. TaxID=1977258 RepID=UPI001BD421FF|nr:DUF962 domain-containing protein [Arsukibacterium sp.]